MTDEPRSLLRELSTPRSLAMLLLALVLAATFAALGQWQLSRAIQQGTVVARPTETVKALTSVAQPQSQQTTASIGQLVRATGRLVPADTYVVADRLNDGDSGYWVVGHAVVDRPAGAQLVVGLGWAKQRTTAAAAADRIRAAAPADQDFIGRYIDSDGAEASTSGSPRSLTSVAAARLLNMWSVDTGTVYEGVLTLRSPAAGLVRIDSPRPGEEVELNLVNVLYAVEWVLFALAALYVWYRLIRDRWELERAAADAPEPAGALEQR